MMITAYPSQMQMNLESTSLLNIANASSDGDSDGGDDKKDDKDKDDDKDEEKEEDDEKDKKDEDSEDNKESDDNKDSDSNDSNDDSKDENTSEDSKDEQTTESQETDVSDTTEESNEVEQTTGSQETDVSEVATVSGEETTKSIAPQEALAPQEATTISPQQTDTSSLAPVTEEGITGNQDSNSVPQIDDAKVQQVADKISRQLIQEGALPDKLAIDLKNILTNELQNNPNGEISKSLEAITGMEQSLNIEYEDALIKQFAEKILEKYPEKDKFEASFLAGILSSIARGTWKDAIGFELTNYNEKGDRIDIGLVVEVNKSSDSKSSDSKKDKNNKQDIDCDDIGKKNIKVPPGDPDNLDRDGDGIGCESNNDDDKNYNYIKKIIKYQGSKCITQSDSIPLAGKIPPKTPILIGDFYPCKLDNGRATLNLPNTPNLQFALIHLDKKNGNHEAVVLSPQKIQNIGQNNALFVVKFNDQFQGQDPITGQTKTIKDVNALALYNKSKRTLDFEDGNGLGITAVLKS
jgi:hypothetical protein